MARLTLYSRLGDVINEWRESIDLEHILFSDGPCLIEKLGIPVTYCWSPALVPKPADWGPNIGGLPISPLNILLTPEAQMYAASFSANHPITRQRQSLTSS